MSEQSIRPSPSRDWSTSEAAYDLARSIEAYWRDRGGLVTVTVESHDFIAAMRQRFDILRSDMVNGYPTRRIAEEQRDAA